MLILKRVSKLMGHYRLLSLKFDPVCEIKLLDLRVVITGNLFRQQLDEKSSIVKVLWHQSICFEDALGSVRLGRSIFLVQVFHNHVFNLSSGLCATLHGSQDRQLAKLTCLLQHCCGGCYYRRVAGWTNRSLRTLGPGCGTSALT